MKAKFQKMRGMQRRKDKKKDGTEKSDDDEPIIENEITDYKNELLNILKSLPPSGFEKICQRMLREAGFEQVTVRNFVEKIEGDLRLGLKGEILWDQVILSSLFVLFGEPFCGHVKLAAEQAIAFLTGVTDKDTGLAVFHFAHGTTILACDADGLFPFFDKFGAVDIDHAIGTADEL